MANAGLYVLLRAVDRFHETHQRFPGSFDVCADLLKCSSIECNLTPAAHLSLQGL